MEYARVPDLHSFDMGIGIVLAFWLAAGIVVSTVGAVALAGLTALLTRHAAGWRRTSIVAAGLFPFACLAWVEGVFVFQACVNGMVFNKDIGVGDTWYCPLPNGYQVMMIDDLDEGTIFNPKTQNGHSVISQENSDFGVRSLQVAGPYIFGAADTGYFEHIVQRIDTVDSCFIADTRSGKQTRFTTQEALSDAVKKLGFDLQLQPIFSVYTHYRLGWFDYFALALWVLPPSLVLALLGWWIWRVRKGCVPPPGAQFDRDWQAVARPYWTRRA